MKKLILVIGAFIYSLILMADGLIVPDNDNYPGPYLKNKSTDITVKINGLIAETIVTQEFKNEWGKAVNGVFSFPLPMNARSTRLMYSKGDTLIDAVLKEKPQSQNPGTGEGGIVAEINKYMGKNAIRMKLFNIPPNGVKTVRIRYISVLPHHNGMIEYNYPFETSDFVSHPLDYLKLHIKVQSSPTITGFDIPSHPNYEVNKSTDNELDISYYKPKVYAADDIDFHYTVQNNQMSIDFYSWKPDTADGYFSFVGRPRLSPSDSILPQNLMFLLCNSSTMMGTKLDQSKIAISKCLDQLSANDSFNIMVYNSTSSYWENEFVPATAENISDAKSYIETISGEYGNNLGDALKNIFNKEITSNETTTSVLTFTDGKGLVDPYEIEAANQYKTGIFLIAMGNDYDRARLETLASLNYGFVSYIDHEDVLSDEMVHIFQKINKPLYKDISIDIDDPVVHDMYPSKFPAIYGNSDFIVTGRYELPGSAMINIEGFGYYGMHLFPFQVDFANYHGNSQISRYLWAKYAIDHLEAEMLIYGETDSLREKLVNLSLAHNIRCRYTAYIEDSTYSDDGSKLDASSYRETTMGSRINIRNNSSGTNGQTRIMNINPIPIVNNSWVKVYIGDDWVNTSKTIKLYNLQGQIIHTIDISGLPEGMHEISLNTENLSVPDGIYVVGIEVEGSTVDLKKVVII